MKQWKKGTVTLACEELKEHIAGKRIALMMNTSAIDNEGRLLIDVIVKEKWAEVAFFFGMSTVFAVIYMQVTVTTRMWMMPLVLRLLVFIRSRVCGPLWSWWSRWMQWCSALRMWVSATGPIPLG